MAFASRLQVSSRSLRLCLLLSILRVEEQVHVIIDLSTGCTIISKHVHETGLLHGG